MAPGKTPETRPVPVYDQYELDELGHTIENFEMGDNLMIEGGIRDSGGQLFVGGQPGEHRFFSAELFRSCVRSLVHS